MWLVVGLGNPGPKYQRNRHNVGFMVIDELASRFHYSLRDKFGGEFSSGMFGYDKVLLQKPMEFMNLSGYAVQRAAAFYQIDPDKIIVVHDDIDLDVGRIKVKVGGGHGGHNGLRSMAQQLGSKDFLRVRVGVGKPGPNAAQLAAAGKAAGKDKQVAGYVLSDFPSAMSAELDEFVKRAADASAMIVDAGAKAAMNEFNTSSEKAEKAEKRKQALAEKAEKADKTTNTKESDTSPDNQK